jgi:hypothetical protein
LGVVGVLLVISMYLFVFVGQREVLAGTPYTLVVQPGVPPESVQLVERTGSVGSLNDFCRSVGSGTPW